MRESLERLADRDCPHSFHHVTDARLPSLWVQMAHISEVLKDSTRTFHPLIAKRCKLLYDYAPASAGGTTAEIDRLQHEFRHFFAQVPGGASRRPLAVPWMAGDTDGFITFGGRLLEVLLALRVLIGNTQMDTPFGCTVWVHVLWSSM